MRNRIPSGVVLHGLFSRESRCGARDPVARRIAIAVTASLVYAVMRSGAHSGKSLPSRFSSRHRHEPACPMSSSRIGRKLSARLAAILAIWASFALANPACVAESANGFLGQTLLELEQQQLFKEYHLVEFAKKGTPYSARVVVFRPAKSPVPFEIAATIDKREHVLAIQLWVRRSFVDKSNSGSGARDIVLKFLREVPSAEDVRQLTQLANEIRHGDVASHSAVGSASHGARPPVEPSAGYLAFTGKHKSYEQHLRGSVLQILNYRDRYGEVLILQLVTIGDGKRERATVAPGEVILDA